MFLDCSSTKSSSYNRDFNDRRSAKVLLSVLSLLFNYEKEMRILIKKIFIEKIDDVAWNLSFLQLDIKEV